MVVQPSPYARVAGRLRDMGYHAMPAKPGEKVPGHFEAGRWSHMSRWQDWCSRMPPEFLHERWEGWPDPGVCIAHGAVVGADVDTDRTDVAAAVVAALGHSPVRRRGRKGWMGYYRPGPGCEDLGARVRWYHPDAYSTCEDGRRSWPPLVELLLHGTQSVAPPTVHPDTGQPYHWLTPDTLEDTPLSDLPALPDDPAARLDAELGKLGLTRENPNGRARAPGLHELAQAGAHDLEKPRFRSMNERALAALDRWFPALGLPKTRQRGAGSWEAVAAWRPSSSGRPIEKRGANLHASPSGIRDFGDGEAYTAIDLVIAARGDSFDAAVEWLDPFLHPEPRIEIDLDAIAAAAEHKRTAAESVDRTKGMRGCISHSGAPADLARWCAAPAFAASARGAAGRPSELPSDAAFEALIPRAPQPFPLGPEDCPGALGEVARHIDAASATATEAGALAVALPVLGAVMGRAFATPSNLRTNILSVALGGSGSGKTSLVNPAKELLRLAGVPEVIGQDRIASGSGLLRMLTVEPRRVCFLDEFGHLLQQIGAPGAGIHSRQILTEFTKLYSDAGSLYTGTAYAGREPEPIDCPHLCLFGMATPEQFWRAFGSSSLEDGSIARFLVFPIGAARIKDPNVRFQQQTAAALKAVVEAVRGLVRGNLDRPSLLTVDFDEQADAARLALQQTMQACAQYAELNEVRGAPAILRRVAENAQRIALISAVGRNPSVPVIEMRDFDIGHALARWSATTMIHNIASHIADNQTERDVNDVERFIFEAGDRGRTWNDVQRKFRRVKARDLRDIFEGLEREGSIRAETEGRPGGHWPLRTAFAA
jgi:hypothetical protein